VGTTDDGGGGAEAVTSVGVAVGGTEFGVPLAAVIFAGPGELDTVGTGSEMVAGGSAVAGGALVGVLAVYGGIGVD